MRYARNVALGVLLFLLAPYLAASAYIFVKAITDASKRNQTVVYRTWRPMTVDEVVSHALREIHRQSKEMSWKV